MAKTVKRAPGGRHKSALGDPTAADYQRYHAFRTGQTPAEIAKNESTARRIIQESTVERSIRRVRVYNQRFSSEEAGIAIRKLLLGHLPEIDEVLRGAREATSLEQREVIVIDPDTGEREQLRESYSVPDHITRLRAIDTERELLSVVQPRDPAVQINSNTQTNILNQTALAQGGTTAGLTSPEAVIRQIRSQRGHALMDGNQPPVIEQEAEIAEDELDEEFEEGEEDDPDGDDDEEE